MGPSAVAHPGGARLPAVARPCHDDRVPVLPGAEPFSCEGGDVAVLLCHGFTGCPQSLRPWAEHLAAEGLTVRVPRLPGHGTSWQELNLTRWPDWYAAVERELLALAATHRAVVVGGRSMGGALALLLAQRHPGAVAGLALVNPAVRLTDRRFAALPLARRLTPSLAGIGSDIRRQDVTELAYDRTPLHALASTLRMYAEVERDLPQVTQPLLLMRSAVDHVVPTSSPRLVLAKVSSTDVTDVVLHDSYHVATLDNDAPVVFARTAAFARRVGAAPAPATTGSRGRST